MKLRQLRYFARVVERGRMGRMGRAAADLGVVTRALSQQISRLESELSTRLLNRSSSGVQATAAGVALLAMVGAAHAQRSPNRSRRPRC